MHLLELKNSPKFPVFARSLVHIILPRSGCARKLPQLASMVTRNYSTWLKDCHVSFVEGPCYHYFVTFIVESKRASIKPKTKSSPDANTNTSQVISINNVHVKFNLVLIHTRCYLTILFNFK